MKWWPSVDEERLDALRPGSSGWRRHGLVLSIVFFGLTLLALAAFNLLVALTNLPEGMTTAVVAIAVAEWLIHRRRFFGTGIESALWIGALFAIIFSLPSSGRLESLLVFVAACAIAGFRVRSALFGCAAVVLVLSYIAVKADSAWPAMAFGIAAALVAAVALQREWQRPSTERLIGMVMIVMPVAAEIAWAVAGRGTAPLPFAVLAALLFALGIRGRDRVTLATGALTAGIAAFEARELFRFPLEIKLMAGGAVLIALAVAITRALRGRKTGFVVEPSAVTPYDEAMQILATLPSAHPASAEPATAAAAPEVKSGDDSSFGGAGAGGGY
ncbi:MAG: hypothetical protein AABO58_21940 [Acidobacteriota bacterium]